MKHNLNWLAGGLAACTAAWLLLGRGEAGGDKGPWQPFLPPAVYQELVKREAEMVRDQLNEAPKEQEINRAKFGAVLIAALTMSVKDIVTPPQRTSMPTFTNATTMPVSWQIGRWPSAHMRELVRIWAIASLAAGEASASYAAASESM